jgi:hypothetical protein
VDVGADPFEHERRDVGDCDMRAKATGDFNRGRSHAAADIEYFMIGLQIRLPK